MIIGRTVHLFRYAEGNLTNISITQVSLKMLYKVGPHIRLFTCNILSASTVGKSTTHITKILTLSKRQFSITANPLCTCIKRYHMSLAIYLIL